jgi:putative ABC transport system permease protein
MIITDLLNETYCALVSNKVRSGLTILGIVIGIGSVIAMVSIGQGTQQSIESSIQSLGSNLLMIMPGSQRGFGSQVRIQRGSAQTLTVSDSDAIQQEIGLVKNIAPEASSRYQITAKGTNTNTQVVGTVAAYTDVRNLQIDQGVFISDQNNKNASKIAVIGPTARDDLFGENASGVVGQTIKINKIEFKVIGITKSKGGTGFSNQDDMVFIPLMTAQRFLTGGDYVTTISVQAANEKSMTEMQSQITNLLLTRHKISDPTLADFSIMNQADVVASASAVTGTLTLLLGAIAGISLIVGGIGIMNMMLTTVTERTREIGLRKAIGAKRSDITVQFLAEAVALTFIGGVIGVALGWAVSVGVTHFANIETKISLPAVLIAFGVSAVIGIIFGYYPAWRAARLNPIQALRYE